jgi:type IV pilus assembly protein PilV
MRQSTRQLFLSRGAGLFDALIALALLSFGLLAMTRLQARMVSQSTESQSRETATQLASELLSTVLVDVNNAACYTLPQSGTCANAAAITRTSDWATRVTAALPGTVAPTSTLNAGTGQLRVVITWTGKETSDTHSMDITTDVRP